MFSIQPNIGDKIDSISINDPLIKNAILFEKDIFFLAQESYVERLKKFEEKYKMSTKEFKKKFQEGKLGDEPEWFDWLFEYKALNHLKEKLRAMERYY